MHGVSTPPVPWGHRETASPISSHYLTPFHLRKIASHFLLPMVQFLKTPRGTFLKVRCASPPSVSQEFLSLTRAMLEAASQGQVTGAYRCPPEDRCAPMCRRVTGGSDRAGDTAGPNRAPSHWSLLGPLALSVYVQPMEEGQAGLKVETGAWPEPTRPLRSTQQLGHKWWEAETMPTHQVQAAWSFEWHSLASGTGRSLDGRQRHHSHLPRSLSSPGLCVRCGLSLEERRGDFTSLPASWTLAAGSHPGCTDMGALGPRPAPRYMCECVSVHVCVLGADRQGCY